MHSLLLILFKMVSVCRRGNTLEFVWLKYRVRITYFDFVNIEANIGDSCSCSNFKREAALWSEAPA